MRFMELVGSWNGGPVRVAGAGLEVDCPGGPTAALQVESEDGSGAVVFAVWDVPPGVEAMMVADLAKAATDQRSGMLGCVVEEGRIRIQNTIYMEGASRQTVTTALLEIARAYAFLYGFSESLGAGGEAVLEAQRAVAEARRALEEGTAAILGAADRSAESARAADAQLEQQRQAIAQPATAVSSRVPWTPTHKVPMQGMTAWAKPDPQAAQLARLDPGLDLEVVERFGDWAHVRASNGWMGWVDGRALQAS